MFSSLLNLRLGGPVGVSMAHRYPLTFTPPHRGDYATFRDWYFAPGGPIHCAREHIRGPNYVRAGAAGARAAGGKRNPFEGLGKFELMHAYAIANSMLQTEPDRNVRFEIHVQRRPVR